MKTCRVCGESKPYSGFYRAAGMRDGFRNDCKACNLAAKHARYIANPDPEIARVTRWRIENPEKYLQTQRRYVESGRKAIASRKSHLKRAFGLRPEDYDSMLAAQGGGCAICGRPPSARIRLHIDHDHESGRIRGLLCFVCNNGLGQFQENPELLRRAAAYVHAGRG